MSAKTATGLSARERLLDAANELFYAEGVHTVGIDRVIERAGVAKASLYNTFGSKDELVRAYLEGRHARMAGRITAYLERYADPRDKLLGDLRGAGRAVRRAGFPRLRVRQRQRGIAWRGGVPRVRRLPGLGAGAVRGPGEPGRGGRA